MTWLTCHCSRSFLCDVPLHSRVRAEGRQVLRRAKRSGHSAARMWCPRQRGSLVRAPWWGVAFPRVRCFEKETEPLGCSWFLNTFFFQECVEWNNWVFGHFTNAAAAAGMLGYFKSSSTELGPTAFKTAFKILSPCCTKPDKMCDSHTILRALRSLTASPSSSPQSWVPAPPAFLRGAGWSAPPCSKNYSLRCSNLRGQSHCYPCP